MQLSEMEDKINMLINVSNNLEDVDKTNKRIEGALTKKVVSNVVREHLLDLLINKIIVSLIDNDKENIELKIFFNFSSEYIKKEIKIDANVLNSFFDKNYEFNRGFDKVETKRCVVNYNVNCYK